MDIPLPVNAQALLAKHTVNDQPLLQLKPGQQFSATVIKVNPDKNTIQLNIAGKPFAASFADTLPNTTLPSSAQLPVIKGQVLKLLVTQLLPTLKLVIQNTSVEQPATTQTHTSQAQLKQTTGLVLTLNTQPQKISTQQIDPKLLNHLQTGQKIPAKIVQILPKQIQIEFFPEKISNNDTPQQVKHVNKETINLVGKLFNLPIKATPTDIKTGQPVTLEVVKPGAPPTFKIVSPQATETSPERVIGNAIKQFLPKQQPAPAMLNQIIKDLPKLSTDDNVPETLKRIARQILQNLPRQSQLSDSKILQKTIKNSGTLLEAKLATASEWPDNKLKNEFFNTDFKANILKLMQALKQASIANAEPKAAVQETKITQELLNKTENTLARLVVDQLLSLPREETPKQVWHLELPFIDKQKADAIRVTIERENSPDQTNQKHQWSVNITITPPALGTIHCKIAYIDNTISTHFRSEQPATTQLIQNHLDQLRDSFEAAGMAVGHMDAHYDLPATHMEQVNFLGRNLLDEKI